MHVRLPALAAALGLLSSTTAARADEPKPGSVHFGFAFGHARVASVPSDVYNDTPLALSIGYTFDRQFAVEYVDQRFVVGPLLGPITSMFRNLGARGEPLEVPDRHQGFAATGALPLTESWRLIGRAGVGRTRVAVYGPPNGDFVRIESRTDPTVGIGVGYDASARWTWGLHAAYFTKTKTTTALLGGQFRF